MMGEKDLLEYENTMKDKRNNNITMLVVNKSRTKEHGSMM